MQAELDHFSVSQLTTYLLCPRKYWFRYVEGRTPEHRAPALPLGGAVHSAIEWWFRQRQEGATPTGDDVKRVFRADWTAATADPVPIAWNGDSAEQLRDLGQRLIELFVERFNDEPIPDLVEERFEVPLVDPATGFDVAIPLVGYVDFVTADVVWEIKTASRKTGPNNYELQLAAYSYAFEQRLGRRPKLRIAQLIKTKEPKLEIVPASVMPEDQLWFLDVAVQAIASISAGARHPVPGWACSTCEFRKACREGR